MIETAYIEVNDCREIMSSSEVTSNSTSNALLGLNKSSSNANNGNTKRIKVQFNPSDIKLSVSSGGVENHKDITSVNKKIATEQTAYPNMTLSLKLIYDRTIYVDSSVLPEIEAFLAIIENPYTRNMSFNWGNIYYLGTLRSVDVEYTMFDKYGIPIRANVNLQINIK